MSIRFIDGFEPGTLGDNSPTPKYVLNNNTKGKPNRGTYLYWGKGTTDFSAKVLIRSVSAGISLDITEFELKQYREIYDGLVWSNDKYKTRLYGIPKQLEV